MYMKKFPCVYMRGGTSKAVIFKKEDLPEDDGCWDDIFLKVMGSPDVKQIDGMGGTASSTSKLAVVSKSDVENIDVDYTFFQIGITQANVDRRVNCGNISTAIGPFAVDEGMVEAVEPVTKVRILNTNTGQVIEELVEVEDGHAKVHGEESIFGVPGTGSKIQMTLFGVGGATTGKLFPTGNLKDIFDVPGLGNIEATVIDASTATVLVKAKDLGMKGTELFELNSDKTFLKRMEWIRGKAAVLCGFADCIEEAAKKSAAIPDIAMVAGPQGFLTLDQKNIQASDMDLCARTISMGMLHKAYPVTGGIALAAAAFTKGTVASECVRLSDDSKEIKIGHPSGIFVVGMNMDGSQIESVRVTRTARRIMDGFVYVRE